MFFSFFIPLRKKYYLLNISEREFLKKLEILEQKLKEEYVPGKYYIVHDRDKKFFIFKNVKFHTSKESGVISRFRYESINDKTIIKSSFRYAAVFYLLLPLILIFLPILFLKLLALGILAPFVVYGIFCFFIHLEAWVVSEEFKSLFEKEMLSEEDLKKVYNSDIISIP